MSKGYCFMTIQKVKTVGGLKSKYIHNYRKTEVDNAIPELIDENEELLELVDENGEKTDYAEKFKERVKDCPKYRKDAVRGLEVITTFSRESDIDIESWKKANVEWLKETFNKAGDDKDNVISVVYHGDETGNVHCHAMVIPVDDKGKLNASYYTDGRQRLVKMQDTYAKKMKQFNLQRGLEGSSASHRDIRSYYANLNNIKEKIPPVMENETGAEYRKRVIEELNAAHIAALGDIERKKRKMTQKIERERKLEREAWKKEFATSRETLKNELSEIQHNIDVSKEEEKELTDKLQQLKELPETEIIAKVEFADEVIDKINVLQKHDPEFLDETEKYIKILEELDKNTQNLDISK